MRSRDGTLETKAHGMSLSRGKKRGNRDEHELRESILTERDKNINKNKQKGC